jgi:hypothetical protein
MDKRGYDDATEIIRKYMTTIDIGKNVSILMHKTSRFESNGYKLYIYYDNEEVSTHMQNISDFDKYIHRYLDARYHMGIFELSSIDRPRLDINTTIVDLNSIISSLKDSYTILKYETIGTNNMVVLSTYQKFGTD